MIVNKMHEIQLVQESKVVKIEPTHKMLSRYDKTVYIIEPLPAEIDVQGSKPGYVEAAQFFNLLGAAKTISLEESHCHVTLTNGAEYELPYFTVEWEDRPYDGFPPETATVKLASGRLSSATLKNLANPLLQCIYVDDATAVSCNSMVACIDGTVTSQAPLLLPPDIISLIEGSEVNLHIVNNDTYLLKIGDGVIYVPIPGLDYAEMADTLRAALPEQINRYPVAGLFDSLKRLSASHETVVFKKDRVQADKDYEPFDFPEANEDYSYNIQYLLSVLQQVKNIAQSEFALLLYGDQFLFMVSPEESAEADEE